MLRNLHPPSLLSLCHNPRGGHYSYLCLTDEETVLKKVHNYPGSHGPIPSCLTGETGLSIHSYQSGCVQLQEKSAFLEMA